MLPRARRPATSCCDTPADTSIPIGFAHVDPAETADALERPAHDVVLPVELGRIGQVLDLASAARAEHATKRFRALRRPLDQVEQFADRIFRLDSRDRDPRAFLGQGSEAKHDDAVAATYGLTVGKKIRERDLEFGSGPQGGFYALFLWSSSVLSSEFASSISC